MSYLILIFVFIIGLLVLAGSLLILFGTNNKTRTKYNSKKQAQFRASIEKSKKLQLTNSEFPSEGTLKDNANTSDSKTVNPHKKIVAKKRLSTNIDEEHKYTEIRDGLPEWYESNDSKMILQLYGDEANGIDLGKLPGICKIYVNGQFKWTSNVIDTMSAQALWQASKKHRKISIEPETVS